jgi:N-acetylneuraminic acid mutarotase
MGRAPIFVAALLVAAPASGRTLSIDERIRAQEAVERVYYRHQEGAKEPFERAVTPDLLERRVSEALRKSLALDRLWHTAITAEALRRETERMASSTRLPGRLDEIYAALGRDRFVFEETVARAALADRMARSFFASDERIHAAAWAEARALRAAIERGEVDPAREHPLRRVERDESAPFPPATIDDRDEALVVRAGFLAEGSPAVAVYRVPKRGWDSWWVEASRDLDASDAAAVSTATSSLPEPRIAGVRGSGATCLPDDSWDNASLDAMPNARSLATVIWTGSEMIVWGGLNIYGHLATGGRYDPATDTWRATTGEGAPVGRSEHAAVWTGARMIVWGGNGDGIPSELSSGGIYDPVSDSWAPTSTTGAPQARASHTAVWTGSALVVWGGLDQSGTALATGGRYDLLAGLWTATSTGADVPSARASHTAVWTGSQMIVWGGWDGGSGYLATGSRYDPASNSWTSLPAAGSLAGRSSHTAVWTGARMVVWGGLGAGGARFRDGARYDPVANTWSATTNAGAPAARYAHVAAWTGTRMIVWGGVDAGFDLLATGGRYDPVANAWSATSTTSAPAGRYRHHGVWADGLFLVWGGTTESGATHDGGRYDPALDAWTPTSTGPGPTGRERHTAVWTGNRMIVWGGDLDTQLCTGTGGRYDPALDTWSETTSVGAPAPRYSHSATWTGSEMIVWGGWGCPGTVASGGRYDPVRDAWTATATSGAPEARDQHSAIWTGTRMIVWGGVSGTNAYLKTGGAYDPSSDAWTPTLAGTAPSGRSQHSAVWTGSRMLIWAGLTPTPPFHTNTGGLYDPASDTWTATTLTGAPTIRSGHDTVWTGEEIVVWGGLTTGGVLLGDGARYDPAADAWGPISASGAPTTRSAPSSVWTGREMLLWGGIEGGAVVRSGFRYDPAADDWTPMTTAGAPPPRTGHTAVWTGSMMIPWGGFDSAGVNTGGRYAIDNAVDLDGDGLSSCEGDCNDADPGAFAVPGEVADLVFSSHTSLSWESGAAEAGPGTVHDVARGDVAALPVGSQGESCVAPGVPGTTATDGDVPTAGAAFWYLVRARNSCGDGGYGAASGGAPRVTDSCP